MTDNTNAERQRRYIAKLKAAAKAGVSNGPGNAALVKELAQAKARIAELEAKLLSARVAPAPAKPKAEKPPLPPDEARDRQIKSLLTRVRNLTEEIFRLNTASRMTFDTRTKIAKALHPERKPTAAERDDAFKAFSQFTSGQRRAGYK